MFNLDTIPTMILYALLCLVGFAVLVFLVLFAKYFKLWITAYFSNASIGPLRLVVMSLRTQWSPSHRAYL